MDNTWRTEFYLRQNIQNRPSKVCGRQPLKNIQNRPSKVCGRQPLKN